MKKYKEHIYFTQKERNGLIVIALFMLMVVAYLLWKNNYSEPSKYAFEEILKEKELTKSKNIDSALVSDIKRQKTVKAAERFEFNPNTISKDSLLKLGVSSFAANNLLKYRAKGGKIKSAEQFSKIYGMEEVGVELEPYIKIPSVPIEVKTNTKDTFTVKNDGSKSNQKIDTQSTAITTKQNLPRKAKKEYYFEINDVDSFQLQLLDGIGPYFSSMIIKYRDRLGGFYKIDQLEEIERLPKETIDKIMPYLTANPNNIKKINVNKVTPDVFGKHPYIGKKRGIIFGKYRQNHPNLKNFEDFAKVRIFDTDELEILKYYLTY